MIKWVCRNIRIWSGTRISAMTNNSPKLTNTLSSRVGWFTFLQPLKRAYAYMHCIIHSKLIPVSCYCNNARRVTTVGIPMCINMSVAIPRRQVQYWYSFISSNVGRYTKNLQGLYYSRVSHELQYCRNSCGTFKLIGKIFASALVWTLHFTFIFRLLYHDLWFRPRRVTYT